MVLTEHDRHQTYGMVAKGTILNSQTHLAADVSNTDMLTLSFEALRRIDRAINGFPGTLWDQDGSRRYVEFALSNGDGIEGLAFMLQDG